MLVIEFHPVKRMIRSLGDETSLNLFSNFKWVRSGTCLSEASQRIGVPSGPFLVSRTGAVG